MVHKRYKSNAPDELLRKETSVHFINPSARKIDFKMFTKHLCEKDEHANYEIKHNMLDDSSYSDNPLLAVLDNASDADGENTTDEECLSTKKKNPKKGKFGKELLTQWSLMFAKSRASIVVLLGLCCMLKHLM